MVTFKKDFHYNSVDPILKHKLESLEVYPVPEMNKKTKTLKTSFEISASSSNYHVMNENVRNRTPIYTNKNNTKLATCWPKVKKDNTAAYEKKDVQEIKQEFKKVKNKLQINLLLHLFFLMQLALVDLTLKITHLLLIYFQGTKFYQMMSILIRYLYIQ